MLYVRHSYGYDLQNYTGEPAAHIPNDISTEIGNPSKWDAKSPPKGVDKKRKVRKKKQGLTKEPTDGVIFTKQLDGYDNGSGERAVGSRLALDTVPLRSAESSTSEMYRDFSSKASEANENSSTRLEL